MDRWETYSQLPVDGNILLRHAFGYQDRTDMPCNIAASSLAERENMQENEGEGQPKTCVWTPIEWKEKHKDRKYKIGKTGWNDRVIGTVQHTQFKHQRWTIWFLTSAC